MMAYCEIFPKEAWIYQNLMYICGVNHTISFVTALFN